MKISTALIVCVISTILLNGTKLHASDPDAPKLEATQLTTVPEIDGVPDAVWDALPWYSLNNVWMDWGASVDSSDYYGRFKVAWSAETDLLYFYVEITDDVLVERYSELQGNTFYNDIIDQSCSLAGRVK